MALTEDGANARVGAIPCPECGALALHVDYLLTAKPFGTYSLAGMQPKVAASYEPYIACTADGCNFKKIIKRSAKA